jgi:hypothetical protein
MIKQNIHTNVGDYIHIGSRYDRHLRRRREYVFGRGSDIDVALHPHRGPLIAAGHFHPIPFFHRNLPPFPIIGIPTFFQMTVDHFPFPAFGLGARCRRRCGAGISGGRWNRRRGYLWGRWGLPCGRRRNISRINLGHLSRGHVNGSGDSHIASYQSSPEA